MPNAMSAALPKDTIHYGFEIASASLTPAGSVLLFLRAFSASQPPVKDEMKIPSAASEVT